MTRLKTIFISRRGAALHTAALLLTALGTALTAVIVLTLLDAPVAAVAAASLALGVMAGKMMDDALHRLHLRISRETTWQAGRARSSGSPE
jgi:hypothetical protein